MPEEEQQQQPGDEQRRSPWLQLPEDGAPLLLLVVVVDGLVGGKEPLESECCHEAQKMKKLHQHQMYS